MGPTVANPDSRSASGRAHSRSLESRCRELLLQGLAPSTRRSYATGQKRFIEFCTQAGKIYSNGSPCPADEWTLCLFVTFLANSIYHSSIKVYLSAVRALHVEMGFPDPLQNCLRLERVLRGIKRSQGSRKSERLPVTNDIMRIIFNHLNMSLADHVMFWAACCLAYFGFLRSSEFTVPSLHSFSPAIHLTVQDISADSTTSPSCIRVNVKASKTDPFRKGCNIIVGKGEPPLCAVEAVLSYLSIRGASPGPLFLFQSGLPLTRVLLTQWLRDILAAANIPGSYSSHSFRIGAATVAARNGVPDHLIQSLGRWASNAYRGYIRTPVDALALASGHLV